MKRIIYLLVAVLLLSGCATQKPTTFNCETAFDSSTTAWQQPGVVPLKVVAFGKSKETAKEAAKKCAIRAVLFKGVPGSSCQHPLVRDPDAERKNASFYEGFFANSGIYLSFVSETSVDPSKTLKEKDGYRVGLNVTVNYSQLQTYLENEKQIRRLGE